MTPEELYATGKAIRLAIDPIMKERGYSWVGTAVTVYTKYSIGYRKEIHNLKETPVFVTVELS
jgi:hypothetical protein